jgi:hypothetical protein
MLSQMPTPEYKNLCSQVAKQVQIQIAFENHKEQWLYQLKSSPVDVVVVDGKIRVPAANHWFWSSESRVNCVISCHPLQRGVPQGWKCVRKSLQHVELGGVTEWPGSFLVLRQLFASDTSDFWQDKFFASVPGQFNHLILDSMATGSILPPPSEDKYISGVGTFPLHAWVDLGKSFVRRKRFRLPNRFSPTGYVQRALIAEEDLKILTSQEL